MPVKMAEHQLRFWQELLSPFPDELLSTTKRGGRELTYVDKRAITNRLDSVCGPDGWYPEYEATARGYKCRLYISVPLKVEGMFSFMHKEDGAGFEEMGAYNKQTNEWEADVDNDEKSGYTNALRRAAQDAWGIGRYLYKKGIPSFLDPNARPAEEMRPAPPTPSQVTEQHARAHEAMASRPTPAPTQTNSAPSSTTGRGSTDATSTGQGTGAAKPEQKPQYDNFKIPRPGKSVFAWCKEMEKTFETRLFDGMCREGEERGWGKQFAEWNQDQVTAVCITAIQFCRDLPTYKGQYEFLFPGGAAPAPAGTAAKPGVNIADLRKDLMTKMKALVVKQLGREPTNHELKSTFENVAASSANSEGHTGEVPESLAKMTDIKWLSNMIVFVDAQIAQAVALPEGEEIPF